MYFIGVLGASDNFSRQLSDSRVTVEPSKKRKSSVVPEGSTLSKRVCGAGSGTKRKSGESDDLGAAKRVCLEEPNVVKRSFYDNLIKSYSIENNDIDNLYLSEFFDSVQPSIINKVLKFLKKYGSMKINLSLSLLLSRTNADTEICYDNVELNSETFEILLADANKIEKIFGMMFSHLKTQCDEHQEKDSGWALTRIFSIDLNIFKYDPLNGGRFIKLPLSIVRKNACLNINNSDNFCFKWCILANFLNVNNPSEVSSYSCININSEIIDLSIIISRDIVLDFRGLSFPLSINKISKFEKMNPSISINLFALGATAKSIVGPLYKTEKLKEHHINLLYLSTASNSHYVLIKNLSKLVTRQLNLHEHRIFVCDFCLVSFSKEDDFKVHQNDSCVKVVTRLPKWEDRTLEYSNFHKEVDVPFTTYVDFECNLSNVLACINNPNNSSTTPVHLHVPIAYSYYIKCSFDSSKDIHRTYCQNNVSNREDCVEHFVQTLFSDIKYLYTTYITKSKPMIITPLEEQQFQTAVDCYLCNKPLRSDRVRDHDHFLGNFRGACHKICNIRYQTPRFFPIFCHNMSFYDSHLFFTALNKFDDNPITAIPQTKETYISFTKQIKNPNPDHHFKTIQLRFLDSYRFLPNSLSNLAKSLSPNQFITLAKAYPNFRDLNIHRKGVFPYEYLDSSDKLLETALPPRKCFYSHLKNQGCSLRDYRYA
ncbi:MAG: hypothetical protein ACRYE7_00935, partial [Janthinobacterium lividum]